MALRNPSREPAKFTLDLQAVWELPPDAPQSYVLRSPCAPASPPPLRRRGSDAPQSYVLRSPWAEDERKPTLTLTAKQSHVLELASLEVLVWEGVPTTLP